MEFTKNTTSQLNCVTLYTFAITGLPIAIICVIDIIITYRLSCSVQHQINVKHREKKVHGFHGICYLLTL